MTTAANSDSIRIHERPPADRVHRPGVIPGTDGRVAHSAFPPTGFRWYALRVRSRFEFCVVVELEALTIETYLPTRRETTRWTDREKTITRPLFPGYVFARFDADERGAVVGARGVVEVLSAAGRPVPVSDDEIASLRAVVDSPAALERCPYVAGSMVRIERGPFAGVCGVVTRTRGAALLTIPVMILGRAVSVEIAAADVETAK